MNINVFFLLFEWDFVKINFNNLSSNDGCYFTNLGNYLKKKV